MSQGEQPREVEGRPDLWLPVDVSGGQRWHEPGPFAHPAGVLGARDAETGAPHPEAQGVGIVDPSGLRWHVLPEPFPGGGGTPDRRLSWQVCNAYSQPYEDAEGGSAPYGQDEPWTPRNRSTREDDGEGRVALPSSHRRVIDSEDQRYALALTLHELPLGAASAPASASARADDAARDEEIRTERPVTQVGGSTDLVPLDRPAPTGPDTFQAGGVVRAQGAPPPRSLASQTRQARPPAAAVAPPGALDRPAGYVWGDTGRVGLLGTVFAPSAGGIYHHGGEGTPIGILPVRHDAQFAMGGGKVGRVLFVQDSAAGVSAEQDGRPIKGEMWWDPGEANRDSALGQETGQWRPVVRVTASIPPDGDPPPKPPKKPARGRLGRRPPGDEDRIDPLPPTGPPRTGRGEGEDGARQSGGWGSGGLREAGGVGIPGSGGTGTQPPPGPPPTGGGGGGGGETQPPEQPPPGPPPRNPPQPPQPPPVGGGGTGGGGDSGGTPFGSGVGRFGLDATPIVGDPLSQARNYDESGEPCPNATTGTVVRGDGTVAEDQTQPPPSGGGRIVNGHPGVIHTPGGIVVFGVGNGGPGNADGGLGRALAGGEGAPRHVLLAAGNQFHLDEHGQPINPADFDPENDPRVPLAELPPIEQLPPGRRAVAEAKRRNRARDEERARRRDETRTERRNRQRAERSAREEAAEARRQEQIAADRDSGDPARQRRADARQRRLDRDRERRAQREERQRARDEQSDRLRREDEERRERRAERTRRRRELARRPRRRPPDGDTYVVMVGGDGIGLRDGGEVVRGPASEFGDWNVANDPIQPLGAVGGPLTVQDALRLGALQTGAIQRTVLGAFGGPGYLESNLGLVARNGPGKPPVGSRIGAIWRPTGEELTLQRGGGQTGTHSALEVVSILEAAEGETINAVTGGALEVVREHRGGGNISDGRPLVLLENEGGPSGGTRTSGSLIAETQDRYEVDSRRVTTQTGGCFYPAVGEGWRAVDVARINADTGTVEDRYVSIPGPAGGDSAGALQVFGQGNDTAEDDRGLEFRDGGQATFYPSNTGDDPDDSDSLIPAARIRGYPAGVGVRIELYDQSTGDLVSSPRLTFGEGGLHVAGDAEVTGKLTVAGLIDPTGLVLTGQGADPMAGANVGLWAGNTANDEEAWWRMSNGTSVDLKEVGLGGGLDAMRGLEASYFPATGFTIAPGRCLATDGLTTIVLSAGVTVTEDASPNAANGYDRKTLTGTTARTAGGTTLTGTGTAYLTEFGVDANTGTISGAGTTITGVGTAFLSEIWIGDMIGSPTLGYRQVTGITSDTSLTIVSAFLVAASGHAHNRIEAPTVWPGNEPAPYQVQEIDSDTTLEISIAADYTWANTQSGVTAYANDTTNEATTLPYGDGMVVHVQEFLHLWVISGGSGTAGYASRRRTSLLNPPTGYTTAARRVGTFAGKGPSGSDGFVTGGYRVGSGAFRYFALGGDVIGNDGRVLNGGTATAATAVPCGSQGTTAFGGVVPPTSRLVTARVAAVTQNARVADGDDTTFPGLGPLVVNAGAQAFLDVPLNRRQQMAYANDAGGGSTTILLAGYWDDLRVALDP